mgnify:CR=1 FL=1
MGVWIETSTEANFGAVILSHPVWVCGLKQDITI